MKARSQFSGVGSQLSITYVRYFSDGEEHISRSAFDSPQLCCSTKQTADQQPNAKLMPG